MAAISEDIDVRIRVVFPYLTKSLPDDDSDAITATGNFDFEPPPQVDTTLAQAQEESPSRVITNKERADNLKGDLDSLLDRLDKIQDAMRKRSKHIVLKYDPELTKNEALANAELEIFGTASGEITYDMFEQVLAFHEKVNKYISHLSIENGGTLDVAS